MGNRIVALVEAHPSVFKLHIFNIQNSGYVKNRRYIFTKPLPKSNCSRYLEVCRISVFKCFLMHL